MNEFQRNLLIFSIYALSVAYVFSKIVSDLKNFVTIEFDEAGFRAQLEEQNLQDYVDIKFKLADLYRPEQVCELTTTVENKSQVKTIYINWEQCTITNLAGQSRRVIRLIPGMKLNLSQVQVFGVVSPGQALTEKLVAEGSLQSKDEDELEVINPLFERKKLLAAPAKGARFTLRLILEIAESAVGVRGGSLHPLNCNFSIKRTPWRRTIVWSDGKKKKK